MLKIHCVNVWDFQRNKNIWKKRNPGMSLGDTASSLSPRFLTQILAWVPTSSFFDDRPRSVRRNESISSLSCVWSSQKRNDRWSWAWTVKGLAEAEAGGYRPIIQQQRSGKVRRSGAGEQVNTRCRGLNLKCPSQSLFWILGFQLLGVFWRLWDL